MGVGSALNQSMIELRSFRICAHDCRDVRGPLVSTQRRRVAQASGDRYEPVTSGTIGGTPVLASKRSQHGRHMGDHGESAGA